MEVKRRERPLSQRPVAPPPARLTLGPTPPRTFPELLDRQVRGHGSRVFLPRRQARERSPVTFQDLLGQVAAVASGLLDLGIGRGDRVGLLAENCSQWLIADLGITSLGAIDVPRGSDTSPAEMAFILRHSGSIAAFVADDRTAQAVRDAGLPAIRHVITLGDSTGVDGVLTLPELQARGRARQAERPDELAAQRALVQADDLLTIVYTSGTTADPKGVMLTHQNVLSNVRTVCDALHITAADRFLSVLPAWHMYERIMDYLALAAGAELVYTDRRQLKDDLRQEAPTVFAAVPRIWETIHDGIVAHAHKLPGLQGRILRGTLELCRRTAGGRATLSQRLLHGLSRRLVLPKVLASTGGRLRLAVSGGGSLPRHVDECLLGIGLPLLNGYGLTETSPVAAVRRPERNSPGHIGPPLEQTEMQARDGDGRPLGPGQVGVLWIRGPQVMRGYYQNPDKTAAVLDAQGWFNSGDLGYRDEHGHFWITGRQKDTIVLAGGENVEPEPLETAIKTSPCIEQAVVVGQDQKILGALLVPNQDCLEQVVPRAQWDVRDGCLQGRAVLDHLRSELARLLTREQGFRPCERIAAFRVLLEPLTAENGLLTPTLKVRRHVVHERYAALLAQMFTGGD